MRQKNILWYGSVPSPGVIERLAMRGFHIIENPAIHALVDALLGMTWAVVFDHSRNSGESPEPAYVHLPTFIDHGLLVIVVADRTLWGNLRTKCLHPIDAEFPWDDVLRFIPDWRGIHFDNIVSLTPPAKWQSFTVTVDEHDEGLAEDERRLVHRSFPKAEEVVFREIRKGFSGSRVFMAYEKRRKDETSISHWTQPRLVKIGDRASMAVEVAAMRDVSPFVPYELRPNLEMHIEGFRKGLFVADFVDRSESMLEAARAGRADAALSNLFNRTLQRWRERGQQCQRSDESFADAAERLGIVAPDSILAEYTESEPGERAGVDVQKTWALLREIRFKHRVATIHGDLHGENVRVRGDDAILIDFGSVKGDDKVGSGAPLCFDVAMLEVALVFTYIVGEEDTSFPQARWRADVEAWYQLDVIAKALDAPAAARDGGWLVGCLQRIRAFGIYEQSNGREYALALAVAMLRMCKYPSRSTAEKGRRVFGLLAAVNIISGVHAKLDR